MYKNKRRKVNNFQQNHQTKKIKKKFTLSLQFKFIFLILPSQNIKFLNRNEEVEVC